MSVINQAQLVAQRYIEDVVRSALDEGARVEDIDAYLASTRKVSDPEALRLKAITRKRAGLLTPAALKSLGGRNAFRALFGLPPAPVVVTDFVMDGAVPDAKNQDNIRKALTKLEYEFSYNAMHAFELVVHRGKDVEVLDDAVVQRLWLEVDTAFGFRPTLEFFQVVVNEFARRRTFHPVIDYLDALPPWDRIPRLDSWLTTYAGVADSEYVRAIAPLPLIAAVRRVRQHQNPAGVKFDELVVLYHPTQGGNKSTLLAKLCPRPEWFTDSLSLGDDPKQTIERTRGIWLAEIQELQGSAREVERVKAFLSRQTDGPVRLAYGRKATTVSRAFICFGSTSDRFFLKDPTGNRRFWPVTTGVINVEAFVADRDQLWAEAAWREAQDESTRLVAAGVQDAHLEKDEWEYDIADAIDLSKAVVPVASVWTAVGLGADNSKHDARAARRIRTVMLRLGFVDEKVIKLTMPDGTEKTLRCWVRDANQGGVKLADLPALPGWVNNVVGAPF
jgi:predicted P-loop ATPase